MPRENRLVRTRRHPRSPSTNLSYDSLEPRQVLAAPVAVDDSIAITQNNSHSFDLVLANDSDPDGDVISISANSMPAHGSINTTGGEFIYTPAANFVGSDSFTYTITDPGGLESTATVNINVNAPLNIEAAKNQLLSGVGTTWNNPTQPGKLVAFGPTSFTVSTIDGENSLHGLFAGATFGSGRLFVGNDHQWLNTNIFVDPANQALETLYRNAVDWLGSQPNGNGNAMRIVTRDQGVADWLGSQGFTNVVNVTSFASLEAELPTADVVVGGWFGDNATTQQMDVLGDYVKSGGGLFIVDYAPGYNFWWNRPIHEAPGNQLVRDAGIFLLSDIHWSSTINTAAGSAAEVIDIWEIDRIIRDEITVSQERQDYAFEVFAKLNSHLAVDDVWRNRLSDSFQQFRVGSIQATPATPITSNADKSILTAEASFLQGLGVDEITAHPTAEAVYGEIPTWAQRVANQTFSIDVSDTGWIATGAYVAPGEKVTIEVPSSLVGQGYSFRINGHRDNISPRSSWDRLPFGISRSFPIESTTVEVNNAFGGMIYLDVGEESAGTAPTLGDTQLTVTGAIEAPMFRLGETTQAEWEQEQQKPAPYAEFWSPGLAMSFPSAWIRDLYSPQPLMNAWNRAVEVADWVSATEHLRTAPERFNVDVQISVGLLHAGYPIQGPTWASEELVDYEHLTNTGNWGYFHELGHEKQRSRVLGHGYDSAWTFAGDTEVTVNIFANRILEELAPATGISGWGYSAHPDEVMRRAIETTTDSLLPNFEDKNAYHFYFQLADGPWGWQGYRDVMTTYVEDYESSPADLPSNNSEEKDQWLIRWSEVTGYDMTEYMVDHFRLEVSQSALDQVAAMNLPSWLPLAMESAGRKISLPVGSSTTIDFSSLGLGIDSTATLTSLTPSTESNLITTDHGNGSVTLESTNGWIGETTMQVTYQSSAGNTQTFDVVIESFRHGVLKETFTGISGNTVASLRSSLKFPNAPDRIDYLKDYDTGRNLDDNFGARTRAYVTAPLSGEYHFWIASDDHGELWLSSDTDPANAQLIASTSSATGYQQWDAYASQKSQAIYLEAGESYYIEALFKEGGGADNLSIAWSSEDPDVEDAFLFEPTVIENHYLTVFGIDQQNINPLHVTSTSDSGLGSLRQAIESANALPGKQAIQFKLPNDSDFKIQLATPLPAITDPLNLYGTTQANSNSGDIVVELDGSAITDPGADGLVVAASYAEIFGLAIGGFNDNAIDIRADHVKVGSNYLGLTRAGVENANRIGVKISNATNVEVIDNVISGNDYAGILTTNSVSDSRFKDNLIGTNPTQDAAIPNQLGIVNQGQLNAILDNIVAGNEGFGIGLTNASASGRESTLQGNRIGVTATGNHLANGGTGLFVLSANNIIGGTATGQGNVIAGNTQHGVLLRGAANNVVEGNHIGVKLDDSPLGNGFVGLRVIGSPSLTVRANVISGNDTIGIFIGGLFTTDALVVDNKIGTDAAGLNDVGNQGIGFIVNGASNATIRDNVISGNDKGGFYSVGGETGYEFIENRVGTDVTGTRRINNTNFGLFVFSDNNQIGGQGQANVISDNNLGIAIGGGSGNTIAHNWIGTDAQRNFDLGMNFGIYFFQAGSNNLIAHNTIHHVLTGIRNVSTGSSNEYQENSFRFTNFLGIDNGRPGHQGTTSNGTFMVAPTISQKTINLTTLELTYAINAAGRYPARVEFYIANFNGSGRTFLGSDTYSAEDASTGNKSISLDISGSGIFPTDKIVALATDLNGNSSEFSDMA